MTKLDVEGAFALANEFSEMSISVRKKRWDDWDSLTPAQRTQLQEEEQALRAHAEQIRTKAVGLVLDGLERDLEDLQRVTVKARKALAKVAEVRKVLGVAAAVVKLGGAVAIRNPGAVVTALGELVEELG